MATEAPKQGGDRFKFGPFEAVTFWGYDPAPEAWGWSPYMRKWGIHLPFLGSVWVHNFLRGDVDRDLHTHPWEFWTFPLTSYVEEVGIPNGLNGFRTIRQVVFALSLYHRPATYAHRVLGRYRGHYEGDTEEGWATFIPEPSPGPIWTLVFHRPKSREWGFWKLRDGRWCWQGWKAYHHEGGKSAPCETEKAE